MTSQKRYRHQQESGNSGARFRDIPPRFKRQKSSSSPTRPSSPTNPHQSGQTADTQRADSPKLSPAIVQNQISSNSSMCYQFEDKLVNQVQLETDIKQTPQAATSDSDTYLHKADSSFVSSPWEHMYQSGISHQHPSHFPPGAQYGYKIVSPPLASWTSNSSAQISDQGVALGSQMWTNKVNNSFSDPRIQYYPSYVIDNGMTNQHLMPQSMPDVMWGMPASTTECYPVSSSPTVKRSESPLATKTIEKVAKNKVTEKTMNQRVIDYSDPDVRTIEMLRELERVADQKENELDGFKTDRKSLVSHHLRMLMCAVDRYTEGIDDELTTSSRHDEVTLSSDSRGSTPGIATDPCKNWNNEHSTVITGNKPEELVWSPRKQMQSPVKSITDGQKYESFLPTSSQTSLVVNAEKSVGQDIAAWDLWSSPTFDLGGVLMNQSTVNSNGDAAKERKPLYQRQTQYF